MTADRTITESELAKATGLLPYRRDRIKPEELRHALDRVGIETVPDPTPEPEGDVIVKDRHWNRWVKDQDGWWVAPALAQRSWEELRRDLGPLKVYRAEEVRDEYEAG